MQLVGAKSSFIRRPFLLNAIGQGFMAGVIAIILLIGFGYVLQSVFPAWIVNLTLSEEIFKQQMIIFASIFVGLILLGIFISFIATFFALNRYIWMKTDKLY
jgi:cell division transport system permease protein